MTITTRRLIIIAALLGASGVGLGAFGAHGLAATLEANDRVSVFETASRYHLIHALAIMSAAWLTTQTTDPRAAWGGYLLAVGVVIFSGSLYILAIANLGIMGAVAPVGGVLLVMGWLSLAWVALRSG